MREVKVTFGSFKEETSDYELTWKVLSHEGADIWFDLMTKELQSDKNYFFRFSGFMSGSKTRESILQDLQVHIDVINKDGRYFIPEKATDFNQDFSNKIHHHFEILAGDMDNPTEYFRTSPRHVHHAVAGLNHCVHDLEALERNEIFKDEESEHEPFAGVALEIHGCERLLIQESLYRIFTLNIDFGDMVLHYSQIGKTWLEAFYDDDNEIFDAGIRPQYVIAGEFDLMFGTLNPDERYLSNLKNFLSRRGKDLNDPNLRLGHFPVAKLVNHASTRALKKEIKREIGLRSDIKKISAFQHGELIAEKIFTSPQKLPSSFPEE